MKDKDLKDTKALQDSQEMLLLDQELLKRVPGVVALQLEEELTMVTYRRLTSYGDDLPRRWDNYPRGRLLRREILFGLCGSNSKGRARHTDGF